MKNDKLHNCYELNYISFQAIMQFILLNVFSIKSVYLLEITMLQWMLIN